MVFAWDSRSPTAAPPTTTASLDGADTVAFDNSDLVTFSGYYEAGTHTVEVATASSGYLLRQSPTDPNAINDPDSDYGNPRHVAISESTNYVPVSFQFDPVIAVSAVVRDAWTMERLEDAAIEFVGQTGPNANLVYSEYPWGASYAAQWTSDPDGYFPTNTILYLDDYDLDIVKSGYQSFTSNNVVVGAAAGDGIDLGTFFLTPIDDNTNQIADAWETRYFGAGSNVVADADPDGDGMGNRSEYVAGTDPTNWYSCLWLEPVTGSNSFELVWYTEPGRTYLVSGTTNLCADTWVQVGGAWEATNGQVEMSWAETNHNLSWNNSYRIEVVPCWWQGTNQVLIRTNDWPTSGGGTNSWTNGPPPLP
ncbi:MAG: hypothetical protein K9M54_08530 [Kiritimatiellales bacterium]|nr:hypothetical protein [Kiritimatiellales bacterium]